MPITLAILYHLRKVFFTLLALLMTLIIWLLLADLIMRYPLGAITLKYLNLWYGFYPMFEHGFRGSMGIYPETVDAHLTLTVSGLVMFFITQYLFLEPGKRWKKHLIHRTPANSYVFVMVALPAAMLTVGVMSSILELIGLWKYLPGEAYRSLGCIWLPQTMVLWFTLLISWSSWSKIFERVFRRGDRFMQLAGMTYCLFVASAICMGFSAVIQIHQVGFQSTYWLAGSYTGIILSASVMLWTLIPALTLIYASKSYSLNRIDLIKDGDQIGKQWFNAPTPVAALA